MVVSTRSGKPHAKYKKEKIASSEKQKEVPTKESLAKDKEAPTNRSFDTRKENEVHTPP